MIARRRIENAVASILLWLLAPFGLVAIAGCWIYDKLTGKDTKL